MPDTASRIGGHILVDALVGHGVDTVFCVPGESFLAALDGLYRRRDRVKLVVCRHEGGAANMAEAQGKMTGEPGICFVTRGPGASNAAIGVHTAFQDSTPMILFIGQIGADVVEREAFQEVDYRRMFGQMAKWVAQIDDADRIPEFVSHAFHVATSGRPGPVVLALPEDMLSSASDARDAPHYKRVAAHPGAADMARLAQLLGSAKNPLAILGGSGWDRQACADVQRFAQAWSLPVSCAFRFQDLFDNRHPLYAGDVGIGINPRLAQRVRECDLLLAIGPRLGEMTTSGYTLIDIPRPRQTLVHVHAGAEELGRVYHADLPINAGMREFAASAAGLAAPQQCAWAESAPQANRDYLAWLQPPAMPGAMDLGAVMSHLRAHLPRDAMLCNGAGNHTVWLHRFYQYGPGGAEEFRTQLAPTSGAMGYAVPSAVAAKLRHPGRAVIAVCGDGEFLMTGQELATAVQYEANIVCLVINNGMYGTIRMHQEREYPARVVGTDLRNPDFAALARAYGGHGERITATAEFAPALQHSLECGRPALIELVVDPDAITPRTTLGAIRQAAQSRGS
jgi:acetolactate synthase-1/2/3 large subunit